MFIKKGCLFFFLLFFLVTLKSQATHIVGGELNYTYLGSNNYEIRLVVYRDCFGGGPAFDNPASIGIFNSGNFLIDELQVFITTEANIPNFINSPCLQPPNDICYEYAEYITTVNLPPIPGGYQLAYQRCCRNSSVANIFDVSNVGATYYATIPDPAIAAFNSNPQFINEPPTFICLDAPFHFDHSAIDSDGDSLVYELCIPLAGGGSGFGQAMPQPPNPPPYNTITYQAPYSLGNIMGGVPMMIDPVTGMLTATPNSLGQFGYEVCVSEYRNGVFLGQTRRDYQVNVVPCPNITVASIFSPTLVCGTLQANFINNSFNASTYNWDFGDPTNTGDSSTLSNPSYTYPDTGIYHAMLIAHSPVNPLCTDTAYSEVRVFPAFFTEFQSTNEHCSNVFNFYDESYGLHAPANFWQWNFGDGNFSSLQNASHSYTSGGLYNVTFISSADSGCTDTISIAVRVLDVPVISFSSTIDTCLLQLTLVDHTIFANNYAWSFGDGFFSASANATHTYNAASSYTIDLIAVSDSGCSDTSQVAISLPPLPVASFVYQHNLCDSMVTFFDNSSNAILYDWDFGDGNLSNNINAVHYYETSGTYFPSLIVSSGHCSDTLIQTVTINPIPHASFTHPFICGLTGDFMDQSMDVDFYNWNFGDGFFSTNQNPSHNYPSPGYYDVTLIVSTQAGCADSTVQQIRMYPIVTANFTSFIVPCNATVRFENNSVNSQLYDWNFGDSTGTMSSNSNLVHVYQEAGNYTTTLIANPGVCADTITKSYRVTIAPVAAFVTPEECGLTAHFLNQSRDNSFNHWNFGDSFSSTAISPEHTFVAEATYPVTLVVENNDACKDSSFNRVTVRFPAIAAFNDFTDTCEESLNLFNKSQRSTNYLWDFGDGTQSDKLNATHQYYSSGLYNVMLIADPNTVCADTMNKTIFAFGAVESHLYIPNAFTPNSDGKNDGFFISGYNKCLFYHLEIFSRWGEKLYESNDISKSWDGYYHGNPLEAGVYVYYLTGGGNELMGHVTVLR